MTNEINKKLKCCYGCGICSGNCPVDAIEMNISEDGMHLPIKDNKKCIKCGLCNQVCPWQTFDYKEINNFVYNTEKIKDICIGNYIKSYLSYAKDYKIRYNSSSGGLVTSILKFALKEKIIDGAIVVRMRKDNPLIPESFVARTEEDILSAAGSKYAAISLEDGIKEVLKKDGKYAVVGLPCHIQAIRKAELNSKILKDRIILHLGLMCSGTISSKGTKLLVDAFDLESKEIESIYYRGKGWPGGFSVKSKNINEISTIRFKDYFSIVRFHTLLPCLMCQDSLNEFSDISFGDAWLKIIKDKDNIGTSVVISRTEKGESVLTKMKNRGLIKLNELSFEEIIKSQTMAINYKKRNLKLKLFLFKLFDKNSPIFKNVPKLEGLYFSAKIRTVFLFARRYAMSAKFFGSIINKILIKYLKRSIKKQYEDTNNRVS